MPFLGIPDNILEKIPVWVFLVGLGLTGTGIGIAFFVTLISGQPVLVADSEWGFRRQQDVPTNDNITPPKDVLEWNQRKYVVDLAKRIAPDNHQAIKTIHECFPRFNSDESIKKKVITKTEANELLKEENQEQLRAIVGLINYLEGISIAYDNGVADKKMFEKSFKQFMGTWYGRLEGFIEVYSQKCDCNWKPFEELGTKWKDPKVITIQNDNELTNCFQNNAI